MLRMGGILLIIKQNNEKLKQLRTRNLTIKQNTLKKCVGDMSAKKKQKSQRESKQNTGKTARDAEVTSNQTEHRDTNVANNQRDHRKNSRRDTNVTNNQTEHRKTGTRDTNVTNKQTEHKQNSARHTN